MEFAIIAAILLYFFSRGGQLGLMTGTGTTFQAGSTPAGLQNQQWALQQNAQIGAEVNAGIGIGTQTAEQIGSALNVGTSFAKAIPIVGEAVAAVANVLLAQHTARLKGAIAENQLIPASVQAFDNDIRGVVAAFNSGQATAAQCAGAVYQMWNALHDYMRSNATGPGRSWKEVESGINTLQPTSPLCDKACTAECCVFWSNFHPLLANLYAFFSTGKPLLVGGGARYTGWPSTNNGLTLSQGLTLNVLVVSPPNNPAYGNYSRPAYTLQLQRSN